MKKSHSSSPGSSEIPAMDSVQELFSRYVVPTYGRFSLALERGAGSFVWDSSGRKYLDMGGGIAVNCLGHAHPEIAEILVEQYRRLSHVSNLYFYEAQGRLAERLVGLIGPGKCFFCNSGAEANEGLFKLARRFGDTEGRFEILTAENSFHGRTLAGIAATGQEKVKAGFGPMTPGFRQVPFNDLAAMERALSPATVAVLIEGIQGEGGIRSASPEYLLGLRRFCDEHRLLLLMDEVQGGHFRTGCYQSWQRILHRVPGAEDFLPDAVAMAKSLGGGLPLGAFWVRDCHADLLSAGSHGTTYGGNPLVCAAALKILEIIERDDLVANIRSVGEFLYAELERLSREYPERLEGPRGFGFMLGLALKEKGSAEAAAPSLEFVQLMHGMGLLLVPAGPRVVRLLPAYNLAREEAESAVRLMETGISNKKS